MSASSAGIGVPAEGNEATGGVVVGVAGVGVAQEDAGHRQSHINVRSPHLYVRRCGAAACCQHAVAAGSGAVEKSRAVGSEDAGESSAAGSETIGEGLPGSGSAN